jgi:hypothetical protein
MHYPLTMRVFFNLTDGNASIPDVDGVEVDDLLEAWTGAQRAIEEMVNEDPAEAHRWAGWRLQAIDVSGEILFSRWLVGNVH